MTLLKFKMDTPKLPYLKICLNNLDFRILLTFQMRIFRATYDNPWLNPPKSKPSLWLCWFLPQKTSPSILSKTGCTNFQPNISHPPEWPAALEPSPAVFRSLLIVGSVSVRPFEAFRVHASIHSMTWWHDGYVCVFVYEISFYKSYIKTMFPISHGIFHIIYRTYCYILRGFSKDLFIDCIFGMSTKQGGNSSPYPEPSPWIQSNCTQLDAMRWNDKVQTMTNGS